MNERIRKLIRNLDNELGRYYWTDEEKEKFAKLIVQECAWTVRMTEFGDTITQEQIARHIEDHFRS